MKDFEAKALSAKRESKYVDFKGMLDFAEPHSWCEIIKDVIAMANSGGGVIAVGLDNKGIPTGFDPQPVLDVDEAVFADKIRKYTGIQFDDFSISEATKRGARLVLIQVRASSVPIVFTRPGTYKVHDKRQKTAFSAGTVYFRHGAKSEPGDTSDLRKAIERQVASIRKSWLSGVRKVVKASPGSQFYTVPAGVEVRESVSPEARAIRITDDPDAPAFRKLNPDITHPFRQKEAVAEINRRLGEGVDVNSYDIQCINRVFDVSDRQQLCHCPKFSSPQYSPEYIAWVVGQYEQNHAFFRRTRERDREQRDQH